MSARSCPFVAAMVNDNDGTRECVADCILPRSAFLLRRRGHRFDRGQAPEAARPMLERGGRDLDIGRHKYALWAKLERVGRSTRLAPCLELRVQPLRIGLVGADC